MARPVKLKVYCTAVGFFDAVVAAPSQKAALEAWGTTTDLFSAGRATVVDDPKLQAEALAHPGEVLRKPRGDEAAMLGPEPPKRRAQRPTPKAAPPPVRQPPPPPDRSELNAAEQAIEEAERELATEIGEIERERAELSRREIRARSAGKAQLDKLGRAKDAAAAAYDRAAKKAGGK